MDELVWEIEKIFEESIDFSKELDDSQVRYLIEKAASSVCARRHLPLEQRRQLVGLIFDRRRRFGILEPLLRDPEVSEIMVNGPQDIFFEKNGRMQRYELVFDSKEALLGTVRSMMLHADRAINEKNPIADARLSNGERICAVLDNVAVNGPVLSVRKFGNRLVSPADLVKNGTMSEGLASLMAQIVRGKYNVIVSGGTSSGKTTFLNVLSDYIGSEERVVTIEDSLELNLRHVENIIRLESREEALGIGTDRLLRTALRLRPDRIVVGEVRGKEAFYMLQAMNTGHDGSMSTIHANSCRDMLSRLEGMVISGFETDPYSVRRYISGALDILIHMKRTEEGARVVSEAAQLKGMAGDEYIIETLYTYEDGRHVSKSALAGKGNSA